MGALQSHQSSSLFSEISRQINEDEFYIIPNYSYTHQNDPYYGSNYTLLAHKQKPHYEIQKYQLFFNTYEELKTYHECYEWRNKSKYLVQARSLKQRINNNLCSTFHEATLCLQRIPIRACEITDIPIQQGLYLLYSCFSGFRRIYQKTGFFDISLDMICVNKQAMVKVWLNTNLSKSFPEYYAIDQNFTQAQFLYKLLFLCQPLIDYQGVNQKFSDFLKNCSFSYQKSPYKQKDNKFCKYSKLKDLNPMKIKQKQSNPNLNLLTFDKVIEYFEGYLSKHKLFVARQMKSIKDLFKIQQKIQYTNDPLLKNKTQGQNLQKQKIQQTKEKIDNLQLFKQKNNKRTYRPKKSTKRTNDRLITDRSITQSRQGFNSYKSEEFPKNIKDLKQPCNFFPPRGSPQISFGYKPLNFNRNQFHNLYSPQRVVSNKDMFFRPRRQRIKTVMIPNISFSIGVYKSEMQSSLSPPHRQKSTSNYLNNNDVNTGNSNIYNFNKNQPSINESFKDKDNKKSILPSISTKTKFSENYVESNKLYAQKNGNFKKKNPNPNKTIYYALQKQFQIDDQIANDLQKFEDLSANSNSQK